MSKKQITLFDIDTSDLAAAAQTRVFTVSGDVGAVFMLQIIKTSTQSFYNFTTKSFVSSFTPECNFVHEMKSPEYSSNIRFPSSSTTDYQVLLLTPDDNTEILLNNKVVNVINKKISQINDVTVTFRVATDDANTYSSSPAATDVTSVGSPGLVSGVIVQANYDLVNRSHDDNAFGLSANTTPIGYPTLLAKGIQDRIYYYEKTVTVDGAASSSLTIKLDDVSGLAIEAILTNISGGSVNGTDPYIKSIDTAANTISLSQTQTAGDGATLTFRGYGNDIIQQMSGAIIDGRSEARLRVDPVLSDGTINNPTSKTVRADAGIADEATDASSTKVALNGTYFIGAGAVVSGPGISGSPTVSAVTTVSSSQGLVTLSSAIGPLKTGGDIFFSKFFKQMTLEASIRINTYPTSDTIINIDLDKLITPGAAS